MGYGGGYGAYWYHPSWYYWTPFHPAFYYGAPYYVDDGNGGGYYQAGGFSFFRLLISLVIFGAIFLLIGRLFFGRKRVNYTSYN